MDEILELENKLEQVKQNHKNALQGSEERKQLLDQWEKLENKICELLECQGVEFNSWDR